MSPGEQCRKSTVLSTGPGFLPLLPILTAQQGQPGNTQGCVLGLPISQGGIQKVIDRASKAVTPLYDRIAEGSRRSLYNHVDETSWPTHGPVLGKMLHWLWVMGNAFLALFRVDPHRSSEAFEKRIGNWKGLLHTDDYGMYRKWTGKRQPCLAHFLRRARRLSESSDAEEARCGKRILSLLQDLCSAVNQPLPQNFYENLEARTKRLLSDFGDLTGKAGCLVLRIFNDRDMLTYFLRDPLASKTNNFAEGLVRPSASARSALALLRKKASTGLSVVSLCVRAEHSTTNPISRS